MDWLKLTLWTLGAILVGLLVLAPFARTDNSITGFLQGSVIAVGTAWGVIFAIHRTKKETASKGIEVYEARLISLQEILKNRLPAFSEIKLGRTRIKE